MVLPKTEACNEVSQQQPLGAVGGRRRIVAGAPSHPIRTRRAPMQFAARCARAWPSSMVRGPRASACERTPRLRHLVPASAASLCAPAGTPPCRGEVKELRQPQRRPDHLGPLKSCQFLQPRHGSPGFLLRNREETGPAPRTGLRFAMNAQAQPACAPPCERPLPYRFRVAPRVRSPWATCLMS